MKIQAGVQVSRLGELKRHLQLWKCFERLYFVVIILDRNTVKYPEYLVPYDDEVHIEDQPLQADASPTALSSDYVADSDPSKEDPKEDPEEDPAEYPADGDDDDDDDEEKEKEEHLA
nr:hypothetical protein [Tanacetum cinerariifolium]